MILKKSNKFLLLLFATISVIIVLSTEIQAAPTKIDFQYYATDDGRTILGAIWGTWVPEPCSPPMLCGGGTWYFEYKIPWWWPHNWKINLLDNKIGSNKNQLKIFIILSNNLYLTTNYDVNIKIYELASGKCVIDNFQISGNNKTLLNNIENNKCYIIVCESTEGIQYKTFFINNNQLFVGEHNEK